MRESFVDVSTRGDRVPQRVLIVDDHPVARHGLACALTDAGFEVIGQATTVAGAVRALRKHHPELAVVDIAFEDTSGLDLLRRLHSEDEDLHTLVLTARDERLYAERCLRAGAQGFVTKRTPLREVLSAVQRVAVGKVYLSAGLSDDLVQRAVHGRGTLASDAIAHLSDRELEVFELIGAGISTREVAQRLNLSVKTIETYRENVKCKLDLRSSVELLREAVRWTLRDE